ADIADILHTLGLFYNAVFMKDGSGTAEKQAAVYLIRALEIYDHLGENFEATVFEILKKLRDIYIGQFKWRTGLHYYLRARKLGKKLKKGKAVSSS
ncbi:MAG TPA: hypothetical protein VN207_11425, partial [Ktedonobacteraceae bacterium]|nr:hypothetical protein [Ktedonobacteraceae bacterium]